MKKLFYWPIRPHCLPLTRALTLTLALAAACAGALAQAGSAPSLVARAAQQATSNDSDTGGVQRQLYVSTTGADSNPGTEALPFRTIERAAAAAAPGSTVYVAPGLYVGLIQTRAAGRKAARIRYVSTVKWGARLLGRGKDAVWVNHGDHADISGFDISGSGRIGILNLGSHTLIEGNHVHHLAVSGGCTADGGAGIDNGNYAGSDGDIIGNIVHDIGSPGSCNGVHGIYSSNQGGRIVNNLVYRVAAYGIHLWHAATRVTIANNTLFANGSARMGGGIVLGNGDAPGGGVLNHTKVINNIIYDNPAVSIKEFCYPGHECTGRNNLFANNLIFNNGQPISLRHGRARNTIAADPRFVEYRADGSGNYQLQPDSPAIAKGLRLITPKDRTAAGLAAPTGANRALDLGANISQGPLSSHICPSGKSKPGV